MGTDARIFVKTTDGQRPIIDWPLLRGFEIVDASPIAVDELGATHEVDTMSRYYCESGGNGHWPTLCWILMTLMTSPNVETVLYGGDSVERCYEVTPERIQAITAKFLSKDPEPHAASDTARPAS